MESFNKQYTSGLTKYSEIYQKLLLIFVFTFGTLLSCESDKLKSFSFDTDSQSLDRWTTECTQSVDVRPKAACLSFEHFVNEHCQRKNDNACVSLAIYQISTTDDLNVIESAKLLLEQSCANQITKGCVHLGIRLIEEGKGGNESSVRRGMELLKDACERASSALACTVRANLFLSIGSSQENIQVMGEGLKAHINACFLGTVDSCHQMAQLLLQPDEEVKKRCKEGQTLLCAELNRRKVAPKGWRKSSLKRILGIACQGNHALSCANLGWLYWRGEGLIVDRSKAIALLNKSCKLGFKEGCKRLQSLNSKSFFILSDE